MNMFRSEQHISCCMPAYHFRFFFGEIGLGVQAFVVAMLAQTNPANPYRALDTQIAQRLFDEDKESRCILAQFGLQCRLPNWHPVFF